MNTSSEGNEHADKSEATQPCADPSCSCNAPQGLSNKGKMVVCLVVALAAMAVVLLNSANKTRTATAATPFATAAVATAQAPASATGTPTSTTATALWGPTLSSFASLNQVAAHRNAVFVFAPAKDEKQTARIRTQIESAVKKARRRGQSVAAYMLSKEAKDYPQIAQKVAPPYVLAMANGAGVVPVTGAITETKLLAALVAASRPSSCGPGGCGPGGCG